MNQLIFCHPAIGHIVLFAGWGYLYFCFSAAQFRLWFCFVSVDLQFAGGHGMNLCSLCNCSLYQRRLNESYTVGQILKHFRDFFKATDSVVWLLLKVVLWVIFAAVSTVISEEFKSFFQCREQIWSCYTDCKANIKHKKSNIPVICNLQKNVCNTLI